MAPSPVSLGTGAAPVRGEAVDISGSWTWTDTVTTIFPAQIAEILGIQPEGPVTHATCEAGGTMSLSQTANTFAGTATQISRCTTRGGQEIVSPFPPMIEIVEGRITGRSIHFLFGSPDCPFEGVVSVSDGIAVALEGTGKCAPELHPGLLKSLSWRATR